MKLPYSECPVPNEFLLDYFPNYINKGLMHEWEIATEAKQRAVIEVYNAKILAVQDNIEKALTIMNEGNYASS